MLGSVNVQIFESFLSSNSETSIINASSLSKVCKSSILIESAGWSNELPWRARWLCLNSIRGLAETPGQTTFRVKDSFQSLSPEEPSRTNSRQWQGYITPICSFLKSLIHCCILLLITRKKENWCFLYLKTLDMDCDEKWTIQIIFIFFFSENF